MATTPDATTPDARGTDAAGRRARQARNMMMAILGTGLLAATWFSLPGTPGPPAGLRWAVRLALIISAVVGLLGTLFGLSVPSALRQAEARLRASFARGNIEARFWSLVAALSAAIVLLTTAIVAAAIPPPTPPEQGLVGTFTLQESDPQVLAAGPN